MAILYDEKKRVFTIHTKNSTYQMMADAHDRLLHLYYGRRTGGVTDYLLVYRDRGFCGNPSDVGNERAYSLAVLPQEFPTQGTGDFRSPACEMETEDGRYGCDLKYVSYKIENGKYSLPGLPAVYADDGESQTLTVTLRDETVPVRVELLYGVLPELDIITRSVRVVNEGSGRLILSRILSANVDFITGNYDLVSFWGHHALERNFQRIPVGHAEQTLQSRRGMSSHQFNPFCILAERDTTETKGTCFGMQMLYSGGSMAVAAQDPFGCTRFQMGVSDYAFRYPLKPGETFTAPEAVLGYSGEGFSLLSIHLADCIREHVMRGFWKGKVTPVLLNSWEAFYFDFDGDKLLGLAKEARDLGVDLLVLDDGWFSNRKDDNSSLGDWTVNERKLGMSLAELTGRVHSMGLKFGLWFEPEMVSEDSSLYRAHPDYALQVPGRGPVRSRNQLVLDFSRKEVVDNIFGQLCAVLDGTGIDYIKWDYNRSIADIYSRTAGDQGRVLFDYILGLYDLLDRVGKRYPRMLIETCSGGGGRFDAGMLYYSRQIWCSDNTDAVDRLRIQYGTSFGYPTDAMGAHVSKVPNEQNGRITPLMTRGITAMSGTFGYELDPAKLPAEEKDEIREQIRLRNRDAAVIFHGDYRRLTSPFEDPVTAWTFTSKDGARVIFNAVRTEQQFDATVYVRFAGLTPGAVYRREEDGAEFPADALMEAGLPLPRPRTDYQAYQWHFTRVGAERLPG
ncbi:MAG: alpha-galactosidase [Lachnospiraceae bacterium]|jgi:alpha-galactosidase